jgi:LmbE family N-acetylglucosaminyl deacetylase
LVITIFGGTPSSNAPLSPFAQRIHSEMGLASLSTNEVVAKRHKEDAAALDFLQVDYLWLKYPDAIYRGNPPYYTQQDQLIGGHVHPSDMWIDKQLAQDLLTLQERLPDTVWYAPLGVGRHVDHQLVCSAADRLIQRGAKVNFYEDFPYILQEDALEARQRELAISLEPALVEISEMLPLRTQAANLYASQITLNFASKETMHMKMKDYTHSIRPVETVHLERYWTNRY